MKHAYFRRAVFTFMCLVWATQSASSAQFSARYLYEQSLSLEPSYYAMNGKPGGKPKFFDTHGYLLELVLPNHIGMAQTFQMGTRHGTIQGFYADLTRWELGSEVSYRLPLMGPLQLRPYAHMGWQHSNLWIDSVELEANAMRLAAGTGILLHKHNRRSRLLAEVEGRVALEAPIPSNFKPAGRWSGNILTLGLSVGLGGGGAPWPTDDSTVDPIPPEPPVQTPPATAPSSTAPEAPTAATDIPAGIPAPSEVDKPR